MRVFFTGGSGKAGRHAIGHLVDCGHRVVNGDIMPMGMPGVADLRIDLTEPGQVFNALSAYAGFDELEWPSGLPSCVNGATYPPFAPFSNRPYELSSGGDGIGERKVGGGHQPRVAGTELADPTVVRRGVRLGEGRVIHLRFPEETGRRVEDGDVDVLRVQKLYALIRIHRPER